jgi:putative SOS response-associated peptidase YedK
MCGRAYSTYAVDELSLAYLNRSPLRLTISPSYNMAPTQESPMVSVRDGVCEIELGRWGLIPGWAKAFAEASKYALFNPRGEEIAEKRTYAKAFRERRCVAPLSGFYEWLTPGAGPKRPHAIARKNWAIMSGAGVWSSWRASPDSEPVQSFSIVTTAANAFMAAIHDRMPVILDERDIDTWLDPEIHDPERVLSLVWPCPPEWLTCHEVSRDVNSVRNNRPDLPAPLGA